MQIVIDLPEELYNYIKSDNYDENLDRRFDYKVRFAVKEGTPLPKGHGRLIDGDYLYEKFKANGIENIEQGYLALEMIKDEPTIVGGET